jgi:Flp pilus assembly protein TadG
VRQNVTRMFRVIQARRAEAGERGAALVEFALVITLLMTLVLGIVEFSIAWNVKADAEAAVRSGGRTASALTRSDALTTNAAAAVGAALKSMPPGEPQYVMIYRVPYNGSGAPPASCASNCSKFMWNSGTQSFNTANDLGGGWPASAQANNCTPGTDPNQYDQVGVYVNVLHQYIGLPNFVPGMGSNVTLDPYSVFRLEPTSVTGCS